LGSHPALHRQPYVRWTTFSSQRTRHIRFGAREVIDVRPQSRVRSCVWSSSECHPLGRSAWTLLNFALPNFYSQKLRDGQPGTYRQERRKNEDEKMSVAVLDPFFPQVCDRLPIAARKGK
jgi:hypothetical protein